MTDLMNVRGMHRYTRFACTLVHPSIFKDWSFEKYQSSKHDNKKFIYTIVKFLLDQFGIRINSIAVLEATSFDKAAYFE